jgi:excisionase family DNA binding protein
MRAEDKLTPRVEYCKIDEIERRFGISRSTIYRLVGQRVIIAVKVGSRTLIDIHSMRRYFAKLQRAEIAPDDRGAKLVGPKKRRAPIDQ